MRQGGVDTLITEEPDDQIGHVRICGGGWPVMAVSTRKTEECDMDNQLNLFDNLTGQ